MLLRDELVTNRQQVKVDHDVAALYRSRCGCTNSVWTRSTWLS